MKVRVHGKDPGDLLGLIQTSAPLASGVELLQRDNVRVAPLDDVCDPLVTQPPIGSPAAVHIVMIRTENTTDVPQPAAVQGGGGASESA